ncbi:MAG: helix-turn-helix domain-containing protein [Methylotenera sp.]|nr:helix-turn-helix domain-containing protein [Methylotenera sp.]MDD4926818.1 helix-turn-helix domain-containing protein [Methylotenera sp.]
MTKTLFSTDGAAEYLGDLKPNTLEGWRVKGVGPRFLKLGRLVRYSKNDLDAYLEAQTRQSTSCNLNEI